MTKKPAKWK